MPGFYSRRTFLKTSLLALSGLALRQSQPSLAASPRDYSPFFPGADVGATGEIARVGTTQVSVYSRPSDKSTILYQRHRDDLVNIYYEVISPDGPGFNPLWYRVWRGYVHSAWMQKVKIKFNPVVNTFPKEGMLLAQVTVPYTPTLRYLPYNKTWDSYYRLYYESNQWISGVEAGPDGEPWYRVHDELTEVEYLSPAAHFRIIPYSEYTPLPSTVNQWDKEIHVSISLQQLKAYENGKLVFQTKISSGVPDGNHTPGHVRTDTPAGIYHVYSKMPSKHMGDGQLTADPEAYELPGVPWTTFFAPNGVAFHGTYWHNNFGVPMSHGCVNMKTEEALWIFRWTTPTVAENKVETTGEGTLVIVE